MVNMLNHYLLKYKVILASGSPRRQQFLRDLGMKFEVKLKEIDEVYPNHLVGNEITDYLAKEKARPFLNELKKDELLITSDTLVMQNNLVLGKPKDKKDAFQMLKKLSNSTHKVLTSVCLTTSSNQIVFYDTTEVTFEELSNQEIEFYIQHYQPFDKAGSYGIQDWIGLVAIKNINGSYTNVVGLPTNLLYKKLKELSL